MTHLMCAPRARGLQRCPRARPWWTRAARCLRPSCRRGCAARPRSDGLRSARPPGWMSRSCCAGFGGLRVELGEVRHAGVRRRVEDHDRRVGGERERRCSSTARSSTSSRLSSGHVRHDHGARARTRRPCSAAVVSTCTPLLVGRVDGRRDVEPATGGCPRATVNASFGHGSRQW